MKRFETINAPADEEMKSLYQTICENGFGNAKPINWFTYQGIRPDILKATWGLAKGILIDGKLPPTLKQMIAMTISAQNGCRYCSVTHTGALRMLGVPESTIELCSLDINNAEIPNIHKALILFALKCAKDPNSVSDDDYEELRKLNITKGEIMETIMMAAFTNFINTWADAAAIALDQ